MSFFSTSLCKEKYIPSVVSQYEGNIHNFTKGCLVSYFYLDTVLTTTNLFHNENMVSFVIRGKRKTFVYHSSDKDIDQLTKFQKKGVVYSIDKLKLEKEKKFIEIAHKLPIIFDRNTYSNARKWNKKIQNPLRYAQKNLTVSSINNQNFDSIAKLHDLWVDYKFSQEKTFKMMFPKKRYIRCCEIAFNNIINGMLPLIFYYKNEIVAVKIYFIHNKTAFLLASYGNIWDSKSQIMHISNVYSFYLLYSDYNIECVNTGSITDKGARIYKQHLPFYNEISYMYSQIKEPV